MITRTSIVLAASLVVIVGACGDDSRPPSKAPPQSKARLGGTNERQVNPTRTQLETAKQHGVPVTFVNTLGMRFVLVPAGSCMVGTSEEEFWQFEETEGPGAVNRPGQRRVVIEKPFYVQTTEVTNAQYRQSQLSHRSGEAVSAMLDGDAQPVVSVSWVDAMKFARHLSAEDPLRQYALPTEEQWEYACRAGTTTSYSFGATATVKNALFNDQAPRSCGSSDKTTPNPTAQVASFPPNAWGLHDMHGNAEEWCKNCYGDYDPTGEASLLRRREQIPAGAYRVLRGGSWRSGIASIRSAARRYENARTASERGCAFRPESATWGFRLVSPLPERK